MKIIQTISRYLIAIVFIFSGFVKAIDPLGSTYKFTDYFDAFGVDWLSSLSFLFAILLSAAELLIGLNLFFKIRVKTTAWALLIFMSFFFVLTLIIALTNPVTDCGCFGDAIILTNWQTFYKNIVFFVPTIIVFRQRNKFSSLFSSTTEWIITSVLFISGILLSIYCYRNLPLIDFRPYKIGTNIPNSMKIPEGMHPDEYKTILIYQKEGKKHEYTPNDAPWSDSTWKWVETKNILLKKGYEPPIHNFSVTSPEGEDITEQLLSDDNFSFLVISCNLAKADKSGLIKINQLVTKGVENGFNVYGMTASDSEIRDTLKKQLKLSFQFYTTDEITLKTMIRSNPGLILIKEGVVIGNWHYRNLPSERIFKVGGLSFALSELNNNNKNILVLNVFLIIGLIAVILYVFQLQKTRKSKFSEAE
jgi:uncharacterized membrane protein YphA (DoxX/SURF4 family)